MLELLFYYFINILNGYLAADFIMGVYHWIKDSYFGPYTPIIGKKFIWNSRLHHVRPRYVVEFSNWDLFSSSAKWTMLWMGPLFLFTGLNPFMMSLFATISLNDVIHKYSHMLDHERPMWAIFMQKIYIFQSHDEHHLHHITPHEINYCPITPFLNVILEPLNFWKRLESVVEYLTGIKARAYPDEFIEDAAYPGGIKFLR